jgi:hypothetical protein
VLADGVVVGRIMEAAAAPVGLPWMWTLLYGYREDRTRHWLAMSPRPCQIYAAHENDAGVTAVLQKTP